MSTARSLVISGILMVNESKFYVTMPIRVKYARISCSLP
jgi:hypothetical protein